MLDEVYMQYNYIRQLCQVGIRGFPCKYSRIRKE